MSKKNQANSKQIELKFGTYNNMPIVYNSTSAFRIQVGKGTKSSYINKKFIYGDLEEAIKFYNELQLPKNYKKRLVLNNKVISRFNSEICGSHRL